MNTQTAKAIHFRKSFADRRSYAEHMAGRWLADANEAEERGAVKTAEKCMAKSQYWLDVLNELEGYNDVGYSGKSHV